jgi:hypothetical protein
MTQVKLYDLCVPYSVTGEEKYQKCLKFKDVTTYKPSGECEYDSLDGYSSFNIFIIGIIVIIVLVFSLAVIYYNIYVFHYFNFLVNKISNCSFQCSKFYA